MHSVIHDHDGHESELPGKIKYGGIAILFSVEDYNSKLSYDEEAKI